ncbi:DUF1818 family protein [Synechococcus sp. AH-551-E02]|nr:DUF1818 family protein [Synechococcus sp. AH-551-E02]
MILQEGPGWRLARDPSRGEFSILVGGEGWAFELTEPEWNDLVALLSTLETQHLALKNQLMAEEAIELELDRGMWWGCLSGDCQEWSLALVLTPRKGRGVEGFWHASSAVAMVAAVRTLGRLPID